MIAGGWEEAFRKGNVLGHVALGPDSTISHEADPFRRVIEEIVSLNQRKRSDYTGGDPWENFKDSARQTNTTPGMSAETLIATKQSRLRQLLQPGREPANEAVRDSLIDRACYALIAVALHDAGLYEEENS